MFCLSIHHFIDIWGVSTFWLLWVLLLWTCVKFFLWIFFFNLCLTLLGLRCHTWAFSSCSAWAAYCGGSSLGSWSLGAQPQQCGARLSCSEECGIFWTRDRACVLCIGRQILNFWTTREALCECFWFSWIWYLGVELLGCRGCDLASMDYLTFWGAAKQFSIAASSFYFPAIDIWES